MSFEIIDDVPPKRAVPPSVAVELALRTRLAGMPSGEQLPSVGDIAQELEVSRRTVQKVLGKLQDEGLVRIWPSYGTFKV